MTDAEYGHLTVDNYLTMKTPGGQTFDIQAVLNNDYPTQYPILQMTYGIRQKAVNSPGNYVDIEAFVPDGSSLPMLKISQGIRQMAPDGQNYVNIQAAMIGSSPLLQVDQGIWCLKDVSAYGGALMTDSNPNVNYGTGGGCVQIGHGFERSENYMPPADFPRINLTAPGYNTLYITAGSSIPNGIDAVLANIRLYGLSANGIISSTAINYADPFMGWNIILDIVNNSHGAIRNQAGNILFGLHNDGCFAWLSTDWDYTMFLDHYGNLQIHGSLSGMDSYDDLAIAKGITTKSVTENGKTKQVIDLDSLSLVRPDADPHLIQSHQGVANFYDLGKVQGFALCCLKNIVLKLDAYDTNFNALLSRVETLENQLKASNTAA